LTEFTTAVSEVTEGAVNLRGYSLEEIMRKLTYTEGAYLSIFGRLPGEGEHRIVDVLLNSLLDHGFVAATITAARYVASGNPQFVPAVAGGLLACGSNTVSPQHSHELIERAQQLRVEQGLDHAAAARVLIDEYRAARKRIPGFGHPTHKSADFRAEVLFEVTDEVGLTGDAVTQYRELHRQFVEVTGKTNLPINIDGAMAAVGHDLGWTAEQTVALAVLSVLPGLMAHVMEELESGRPLRHITTGAYQVKAISPLPTTNGVS